MAVTRRRPNRKGVFFTLMALLLISFLILSDRSVSTTSTISKTDTAAAHARIMVVNNFISTMEIQTKNSLRSSGYLTMQNISTNIRLDSVPGDFPSNINDVVYECMTAPIGADYATGCYNKSLNYTLIKLSEIAKSQYGIEFNFTIIDITVEDYAPYTVSFNLTFNYTVTDPAFATWIVRSKNITAIVDLSGVEDPLYSYGKKMGYVDDVRKITKSKFTKQTMNNSYFKVFYDGLEFIPYDEAPSILQRFKGDFTAKSTCCGIESVVHHGNITAGRDRIYSFVDFQYFNNKPGDCTSNNLNTINDRPSVRIHDDHLDNSDKIYFKVDNSNAACP